jgi:glycosyltransferase involved in cell wall biosynthesis
VHIAWVVYGDLAQPTGGYIYDRLVVEGLRARGDEVAIVDPLVPAARERADVWVGDALCVREVGPLFEDIGLLEPTSARVLLVHHLPSWETERTDRESMRECEARALASSDHVVATGAVTGERLARDLPGLVVDVVVPGADRLPRVPRLPGTGPVEILLVGSIVARKRVGLLLDALETLPAPRPRLTLLGDPGREPAYARSVAERIEASVSLRGSVTIAGVVGDEELAHRLACADALVLPSSLEGYGMVLTEALHAGLPVIAARPAADAASIAAHGAVRVFDDGRDLAEVLARFAHDPALREAMRHAADASPLPTWSGAIEAFRRTLEGARGRAVSRQGP